MKIKDILKIESFIDKRATPSDVLEHLDTHYYSKSKDEHIKYVDMHIAHFVRVYFNKDYLALFNDIIKRHNDSVADGSYYEKHPEIKPPKDSNGR